MVVIFPDSDTNELIRSFKPDYTPYELFSQGVFMDHVNEQDIAGYWRPIYSTITGRNIKDDYKKYDWGDLQVDKLVTNKLDIRQNKYGVKAGQSLKTWEDNGWIKSPDPRGWVQWYCEFFAGRRIPGYDDMQIKRWINLKQRFCGIKNKSDTVKQTLLNWGINSEKC